MLCSGAVAPAGCDSTGGRVGVRRLAGAERPNPTQRRPKIIEHLVAPRTPAQVGVDPRLAVGIELVVDVVRHQLADLLALSRVEAAQSA